MALLSLSSDDFPEAHRLDASVDFYARIGAMDIDPAPGSPFRFGMKLTSTPALSLGDLTVSACTARRSRREAQVRSDVVVIGLALGPEIGMSLEGGESTSYARGQACIWDGELAGRADYHAPSSRLLNLVLPRSTVMAAACDLRTATGNVLPGSPLMRLMTHYALAFLDEAENLSETARNMAGRHMSDMALLLLGAGADHAEVARSGGLQAGRLAAIKADISSRLLDPALSIKTITSRHRISERYLRALFAREGKSFTDFVRTERLDRAARLLADPLQAGRRISDIAYDSGFADLSYFNRVFRAQFDTTPSDFRAQALERRA